MHRNPEPVPEVKQHMITYPLMGQGVREHRLPWGDWTQTPASSKSLVMVLEATCLPSNLDRSHPAATSLRPACSRSSQLY